MFSGGEGSDLGASCTPLVRVLGTICVFCDQAIKHVLWPMARVLGIRAYSMSTELGTGSQDVL